MTHDKFKDTIDEMWHVHNHATCNGGQQTNTWCNAPSETPARVPPAHPAADRLRATITRIPDTPSVTR